MIDYNADYEHGVQPDQGMCLYESCGKIFQPGLDGNNDLCSFHAALLAEVTQRAETRTPSAEPTADRAKGAALSHAA